MEAIILAGGLGTRLEHLTKVAPKSMVLINGRPFLEYLLNYLMKQDVSKVILAVGYKYEIIKNYFKNKYQSLKIEYSVETKRLGTGGAIKLSLEKTNEKEIFVINGDTLFDVNLQKMLDFHIVHQSELTIAAKFMENFDRYGKISTCENRIIDFEEKKYNINGYINGGIYIINRNFFNDLKLNSVFSLETDIMEKYVNNKKMYSYKNSGRFIDIGTLQSYKMAVKNFLKAKK